MAKTTPARAAPLTPKQQRFVQEYLKDQNGTQAAIRTGYSEKTAKQQGSRLLTEPFQTPSGALMRFPGDTSLGACPEETIGCRCMKKYRVNMAAEVKRGQ
ncbi:terminase small subunit [Stenotrophomonas maltophilia]|nr:terminase small subunit [Stenotrophomonas maltophilia]